MTLDTQLYMLKSMTGETDNDLCVAYLDFAGEKVLRRAYPFDPTQTIVPDKYHGIQVQIAAYLLNKRGAEGETSHSENGISRAYEDGDVPASLLRDIVPFASTFRVGRQAPNE